MVTKNPAVDFAEETSAAERFAFGENWRRFLAVVDDERIAQAQSSLREMLDRPDLRGLTWLDIGSGSGLFSLAASRLGATRLHAFDVDPGSVACTDELRRSYGAPGVDWTVEQASVLDAEHMRRIGCFDVVYAWGVLHHTGDMWTAIDNATRAVADGGHLFISIYNDQGTKSRLWRGVKRLYVALPAPARMPLVLLVMVPRELLMALKTTLHGRPLDYIRGWTNYKSKRGMSSWHDLVDWVGGYPFEVAKPEEILAFLRPRGFELERMKTCGGGLGCNQFVFTRRAPA